MGINGSDIFVGGGSIDGGDEMDKRFGLPGLTALIENGELKDIGLVVIQGEGLDADTAVEAGLTIVVLDDAKSECPPEPHVHEHKALAVGRITYAKAMNFAVALMQIAATVAPLDKTERGIVERINARIEEAIAEQEAHQTDTATSGGKAINVI